MERFKTEEEFQEFMLGWDGDDINKSTLILADGFDEQANEIMTAYHKYIDAKSEVEDTFFARLWELVGDKEVQNG